MDIIDIVLCGNNSEIKLKAVESKKIPRTTLKEALEACTRDFVLGNSNKKCSYNLKINAENVKGKIEFKVVGKDLSDDEDNSYKTEQNFNNFAGLIRICFKWNDKQYYSDLFPVANLSAKFFKNQQTDISNILEYIRDNGYDKLQEKGRSLDSQLKILKEIQQTYQENYSYFKTVSHYKFRNRYAINQVEKAKIIDATTIRYVASHPEQLRPSSKGIYIGKKHYLPEKALLIENNLTLDTYENQVLIGFLQTILNEVERQRKEIEEIRKQLDSKGLKEINKKLEELNKSKSNYIFPPKHIFQYNYNKLEKYQEELNKLHNSFTITLCQYKKILPVTSRTYSQLPKNIGFFLNDLRYRKIYYCIVKWFHREIFSLQNDLILNFHDSSYVYEIYILVKLITNISACGYELVRQERKKYGKVFLVQKNEDKDYPETDIDNTFVFKRENETLTLFYQPIIYGYSGYKKVIEEDENYKINLYRSNLLDKNEEFLQEISDNRLHYNPDYLFKWENGDREVYLTYDAKYSYRKNIIFKLMGDVIYKYLLSINTYQKNNKIIKYKGIGIFYGILNGEGPREKFIYSSQDSLFSCIKVLPFSEDNQEEHLNFIKNILDMLKEE